MGIKINIPADANELIHTLHNNGYSAYIVGGCVRDSVLGRIPHDWDICTSATPDEMLEVFKNKKVIKTGLKHGTLTVMEKGEGFEITTYRIDGTYSDSRRPDSVSFTNSLEEDLKRRDFTINAMAYNDEEGLIDLFGGIDDINAKIIRCVGNPKERFEEDALRIMRAIRFAAQLDFEIEEKTDMEIRKQRESLKKISCERINNEFCKVAVSDCFDEKLDKYKDVFCIFIPELSKMIGFEQNNKWHIYDIFKHTLCAIRGCESNELIIRLAVLFHDIGKPKCFQDENDMRHFKGHAAVSREIAENVLKRLRFSNEIKDAVTELVYYHDVSIEIGKKYIKRWLNKIGEVQLRRLLIIKKADNKAQNPEMAADRIKDIEKLEILLNEVIKENECFTLKDLAVNGNDLISIGYKPGKEIGHILNGLLQAVINGECKNEKDKLLKSVSEI